MGRGKGSREEVRGCFRSEYPLPTGETEGRTLIKVSSFMTSDKRIISYKIIKYKLIYSLEDHGSQDFKFGNYWKSQSEKAQACLKTSLLGTNGKVRALSPCRLHSHATERSHHIV